MRKVLFICTLMLGFLFSACDSCNNKPAESNVTDTLQVDSVLRLSTVDHIIATDRQAMFLQVSNDYRWFETCVQFNDYLDEENDGAIHSVTNVFQVVIEKGNSADVTVYAFTHLKDTAAVYSKQGFWIEDCPLEQDTIKLGWQEAYDRMMAVNAPKPHSKQACLRKPVGPLDCNPQYVFGNIREQLWVDAITGDVKDSNPAFPVGFKMPLGEWP